MAVGTTTASSTGYGSGGRGVGSSGGGTSPDEDEGYSVSDLRKKYTDFLQSKDAELQEQRLARHYYHGDQLTKDQLKTLQDRGQPATIRDKASRKINGVVGLLERMKQDPKAYPRTPKHEEGAETATASIRYVLDANNWNALSAEEARDGAINGLFGVELDLIEGDQGDPDIGLNEIDNDTFFYDPTSYRYDFSDARYMGVAKWVHVDIAKELFPDMEDEIDNLVTHGATVEGWQQRDRELKWTDSNEKRIFLVEHWGIHKGEWVGCFYCGDTKLKTVPSPFFDEKGKTASRYVMGSVNVDHDGDRYGYLRLLKTLIDELNALVSKRSHLINTRRIIMEDGAVVDVDVLRKEAVRADGVIVRNPGKELAFDDARAMADIQAINEAIAEVKTEIENFGPNPALIGQGIENKSGRAIALLQQAGVAELGPGIISNRDWKIRVYRAVWNAIRRYWTAERWIRVTDEEGSPKFMGLNVTNIDPMTGQAVLMSVGMDGQPMAQGGVDSLDVDIILDEGPDTLNVMQDTFETLQALAQNGAQVPPDVLIMASNLPASEKKKILERMEAAQQPKPFDEAVMKGKIEELTVDNEKTKAETMKIMAEAGGTVAQTAGGAPGGPMMGHNGGPPMAPPIDPIAAAEQETKAKSAEAKAMADRSVAYKNTVDASIALAEAKRLAREAKRVDELAENEMKMEEAIAQMTQMMQVTAQQSQQAAQASTMMAQAVSQMAQVLAAPKRIVKDEAGHPVGVETVA